MNSDQNTHHISMEGHLEVCQDAIQKSSQYTSSSNKANCMTTELLHAGVLPLGISYMYTLYSNNIT